MNKTNVRKLIFEGESVTLDFKKTITSCEKIARTMVSFANNKGGKLLIGVADDRAIKGVKSEEEEKYMITRAAHLFSRPALDPIFEEIYVDDKVVLLVDIPASDLKPHYALADDGKWWAYVRVKDKSVLASKIVLEVLKRSSNDQGVLIEYSDNERTLRGHLEKAGRVTIKECAELLKVGRRRAQNLLVDLILSGIVKINTTEKEEYYTPC